MVGSVFLLPTTAHHFKGKSKHSQKKGFTQKFLRAKTGAKNIIMPLQNNRHSNRAESKITGIPIVQKTK